ncbi:hypothetical protein [Peribacillus loiseleuriae]|uniref:hypothetical protein n=1 Tax=Peribacillus loiseleuriae TaxID=1679170 RepID=UPI000A3DA84B|nr:hypothetical protein [Peribacillus loiseleuriae]
MTDATKEIDLSKTYTYKEMPDIQYARCDNCDYAHFNSSRKNGLFLRECRNCGMKKTI